MEWIIGLLVVIVLELWAVIHLLEKKVFIGYS